MDLAPNANLALEPRVCRIAMIVYLTLISMICPRSLRKPQLVPCMEYPQHLDCFSYPIGNNRPPAKVQRSHARRNVLAQGAAFGKGGEVGGVGFDRAGVGECRVGIGAVGDPVVEAVEVVGWVWRQPTRSALVKWACWSAGRGARRGRCGRLWRAGPGGCRRALRRCAP